MAALMLEELAALHWDTVNQVRTATEISRFALGQVDPTAALHRTAYRLDELATSSVQPRALRLHVQYSLFSSVVILACFFCSVILSLSTQPTRLSTQTAHRLSTYWHQGHQILLAPRAPKLIGTKGTQTYWHQGHQILFAPRSP